MHYVKQFKINGVDTKQVACIELKGKPNTATEGAVGLLGIDMSSPLHEIYKCVAVNGSIYTWELFSSGMSIVSASMSGGGEKSAQFPYDTLKTPSGYIVKIGDLILDNEGYLYYIGSLNATYCGASYCDTRVVAYGMSAYDLAVEEGFEGTIDDWFASLKGKPGSTPVVGDNHHWWIDGKDTGVDIASINVAMGSYVGTGEHGKGSTLLDGDYDHSNVLTFDFLPKVILFARSYTRTTGIEAFRGLENNIVYRDSYLVHLTEDTDEWSLFTWGENTVSWYSPDDAGAQLNSSGVTYHYVAIG